MKHCLQHTTGMILFMLFFAAQQSSAQCSPPNTFWLSYPPTATSIPLNWSPVADVTQYKIRYWELATPSDKTVLSNIASPSFLLTGLKKDTRYVVQIRAVCGAQNAPWSVGRTYLTAKNTAICAAPSEVALNSDASTLTLSWSSTGSHTVRYRAGASGDWAIPTGALDITASSYTIAGLSLGDYQVEVKRNCDQNSSNYVRVSGAVQDICATPSAPIVTPGPTIATIHLPHMNGVTGYNIAYRTGQQGNWIPVANNINTTIFILDPPLQQGTAYQVQIQAICPNGNSNFSLPTDFETLSPVSCLKNKDYGKHLDMPSVTLLNNVYNSPSQFTYASMIGLNDGGLFNRAFQIVGNNPLTQLTKQFRGFHPMDEDFNSPLVNYQQNIKPKDTQPEGTPSNIWYNQFLYETYRNAHGFESIVASTELLQYEGLSWKDKTYKESDWSAQGPSGMGIAFENYTKSFIETFAPPGATANQILVSTFQVGNEWWDYPVKTDYHNLLTGARNAFVKKYGDKTLGGWKMKLAAGAFQAFRDNNCGSFLRDVSNCGPNLERHDFIGDYLDVLDCAVLRDLDAIDCHSYSVLPQSLTWTYPENPSSEGWQIRNLAAWRDANRDSTSGVLKNTQLWATEYGFDSHPGNGVGEKTQSAYLIRGLLLHSRYHFEKVFFYNGFDHTRETDMYYGGLYNSSGFWKLGVNPANNLIASPLPAHGAKPKPAWFGMLDFKARFGDHVFMKALAETPDAFVYLLAKPDSSDPYLVFWSPKATDDNNIYTDIPANVPVSWAGILPEGYVPGSLAAQFFAASTVEGGTFVAHDGGDCGAVSLTNICRAPAFMQLVACTACPNIVDPGQIAAPLVSSHTAGFDPEEIANVSAASGGSGGDIQYQWQQSENNIDFTNILGAYSLTYDPPAIKQTTYFRRAAKRSVCDDFRFTSSIALSVATGCPSVSFERILHANPGCNSAGDYYFEIKLGHVQADEQILLAGLPTNGINIPASSLNGTPMTTATFLQQVQYVNANSLRWLVSPTNGTSQVLKIYFCWVNQYPHPVALSTATSACSDITYPCLAGVERPGGAVESRQSGAPLEPALNALFTAQPNPGNSHVVLTYTGQQATSGKLRIIKPDGAMVYTEEMPQIMASEQWTIQTAHLPSGVYLLFLQTGEGSSYQVWEKL